MPTRVTQSGTVVCLCRKVSSPSGQTDRQSPAGEDIHLRRMLSAGLPVVLEAAVDVKLYFVHVMCRRFVCHSPESETQLWKRSPLVCAPHEGLGGAFHGVGSPGTLLTWPAWCL